MKRVLKRVIIGLAAGAIVVLIALSFKPSPAAVESGRVTRGPLQVAIEAEGKTRVSERFVVAAPVSGKLKRIALQRGDQVGQGEAVAVIEPLPIAPLDPRQLAEARSQIATAEQLKNESNEMVERARADWEQALREYRRAEQLVESGDISKQEFERIRNVEQGSRRQLQAAQFKEKAAASEIDLARAALLSIEQAGQSGKTAAVTVRAPVRGKVFRVLEESERVVAAGTALLELSGHSLEIVIDVLSVDAVKIKPGMPIFIEDWGGDQSLEAQVRLVEPSAFTKVSALGIEEQRVNVIADFLGNSGPLGDGYRIEGRIIIWKNDEVLKVPSSALFRSGDKWSVFAIENGKAKRYEVEIGHRSAFEVEILEGINPNTRVILHPANDIRDGTNIEEL